MRRSKQISDQTKAYRALTTLPTYCLEAQAMIDCTVIWELMSYSEVLAMTYYTEVMALLENLTPNNYTEKMEMMKFGLQCMVTTKFGVVLVMT